MVVDDNQGNAPNYYPNSFTGPEPMQRARDLEPSYKISGDAYRIETGDEDNFTQPRIFWNSVLNEAERQRLVSNIATDLVTALDFIQDRAVANFTKVSTDFGESLIKALKAKRNVK